MALLDFCPVCERHNVEADDEVQDTCHGCMISISQRLADPMYFARGLDILGAQNQSDDRKLAYFMSIFHPEYTPQEVRELTRDRHDEL